MIDSLGVEYDYESVMHYGRFDFSKYVFLPTLRAKKPGKKISPSRRLSPLDAKQANLLYEMQQVKEGGEYFNSNHALSA